MITNAKQYHAAKEMLKSLKTSQNAPTKQRVAKEITRSGRSQIEELIDEIQTEINAYDGNKDDANRLL